MEELGSSVLMPTSMDVFQCYQAYHHLILVAHSLGLSICWALLTVDLTTCLSCDVNARDRSRESQNADALLRSEEMRIIRMMVHENPILSMTRMNFSRL